MPREADPELPGRILQAADALWQKGGEDAVTIRGVAAAAKTTTPTVYSYFASREALLTALRSVAYERFTAFLKKSKDLDDNCARHLEFAERYGRDYELLFGHGWLERVTPETQIAEIDNFAAVLVRAGVAPSRARNAAYPILMMLHGVIMHHLSNRKPSGLSRSIKAACLQACRILIDRELSMAAKA